MNIIKKSKKLLLLSTFIMLALSMNAANAYNAAAITKYNQGIDYSKTGNYTAAVIAFKQAIAIDPTFTDAYYNLGAIYDYQGNIDGAIAAFDQLLKKNPSDSETAYKIASMYYKKGNYQKALSYVSLVPSDSTQYDETQVLYRKIVQKINSQPAKPPQVNLPKVAFNGFKGPTGITQDAHGNFYIASFGDNSIIKVTPQGQKTAFFKGTPLNGPIGLTCDATGNIYVANYNANQILKLSPQGKASILLKNIKKPYYLYFDKSGILYISEQGTNAVLKYKLN